MKEVNEIKHNKNVHLGYIKWMRFILRRSDEVGKVELPITAVIIDDKGRCIGRGSNKRETNKDPLGHAELIALRQAAWIKNDWRFNECSIIVNLEPCTMCAAALVQARIGHVIYGAEDSKRGGFGGKTFSEDDQVLGRTIYVQRLDIRVVGSHRSGKWGASRGSQEAVRDR